MRHLPLIVMGACAAGLIVTASTADAEPTITGVDAARHRA
jgi:predicted flavoprotein YhiN